MNEPQLTELIGGMLERRADQLSLVRKPAGISPASILVIALGAKAQKKLGGAILTFVKEQALGDAARLHEMDFQKSCGELLNWNERQRRGTGSALGWSYGTFGLNITGHFQPVVGTLFVLSGTETCVRLGEFLTVRGLNTSLA